MSNLAAANSSVASVVQCQVIAWGGSISTKSSSDNANDLAPKVPRTFPGLKVSPAGGGREVATGPVLIDTGKRSLVKSAGVKVTVVSDCCVRSSLRGKMMV